MPTPNWGPQSGVPMDQATFDAYVVSNPPGTPSGPMGLYGTAALQPGAASASAISPLYDQGRYKEWSDLARAGPTTNFTNQYQTDNQEQARLQQEQVIQDLQRAARGDPNSQAQQQLQQGYRGAQQQQASLGSTMRGQSAGAAMRGVQAGQQGIQRGLAGDQQMLQVQEQQAAQAMLAQLLAQQYGQDINQAQGSAQGALNAEQLNDQMVQFYASAGMQGDTNQLQSMQDFNRARYGFDTDAKGIQDESTRRLISGGATALTTGAGMIDTRSDKQKIDDAFNNG